MEICALDAVQRFRQIEKTVSRSQAGDAQSAGDGQSSAPGGEHPFPTIHQWQAGVEFDRQRDGILFACVEVVQRGILVSAMTSCTCQNPKRWRSWISRRKSSTV